MEEGRMDEQFDGLTRVLAGALPRRRALKLIVAGAVGMGATALGLRPLGVDALCTGRCHGGVCSAACCSSPFKRRAACSGVIEGNTCSC
jgi:hypothetical protein